jgi:hypothetical protein
MTRGRRLAWVVAVAAALLLTPYLRAGYYRDDMLNSLFRGHLLVTGGSFWTWVQGQVANWFGEGRVFPLAQLAGYGWWYFFPRHGDGRVLHVALTLANVALFALLLARLGAGRRLVLLSALFAPAIFQVRDYHDPITSYPPLLQLAFGFGMAGLLFQVRPRGARVAGTAAYALALLTYEVALVFLPLALAVAWARARGRGLRERLADSARRIAGPLAVTAAYFAAVAALKLWHVAPGTYSGTRLALKGKSALAYLWQFSGAVPLSYPVFGRSGIYTGNTLLEPPWISFKTAALIAGLAALVYAVLRLPTTDRTKDRRARGAILGVGLVLAFVPPLFVALSARYQQEIGRPGHAYLPVYFSYFGLALLIARALARRATAWGRASLTLVSAAVATGLALGFTTNGLAVEKMNREWKYPRLALEKALRAGLVQDLPEGAVLLFGREYHYYFTSESVQAITGRKLRVTHYDHWWAEKRLAGGRHRVKPAELEYLVRFEADREGRGYVILARLESVDWDAEFRKVRAAYAVSPVKSYEFAPELRVRERAARGADLLARDFSPWQGDAP